MNLIHSAPGCRKILLASSPVVIFRSDAGYGRNGGFPISHDAHPDHDNVLRHQPIPPGNGRWWSYNGRRVAQNTQNCDGKWWLDLWLLHWIIVRMISLRTLLRQRSKSFNFVCLHLSPTHFRIQTCMKLQAIPFSCILRFSKWQFLKTLLQTHSSSKDFQA